MSSGRSPGYACAFTGMRWPPIMDGILADGILEALTEMTRVMHDHNSINYNSRFAFMNLECNAHLQRDIQKSADETGHKVLLEIKQLISGTIRERNDRILSGEESFGEAYIENFNKRMTELLEKVEGEAAANESVYSGSFECAVIARIINYRENFFAWVEDFSLPTTNNLSEKALRDRYFAGHLFQTGLMFLWLGCMREYFFYGIRVATT